MKLKDLRLLKNLTRKELSDLSGVKVTTIANYETGAHSIQNARIDILDPIASVLGCKISDLLDLDPLPRRNTNYFFLCLDGEKLTYIDADDLPTALLKFCETLHALPLDDHTIKTPLLKYEILPLQFPDKLYFYRLLKFQDISDLAAAIDKSGGVLANYENGRLDIRKAMGKTVYEIAKALDVDIEDLIK